MRPLEEDLGHARTEFLQESPLRNIDIVAQFLSPYPIPQCKVPEYFDRGRYDGADTPAHMEARQMKRELFEAAGLEMPEFENEANAPEITAELRRDLLALARHELGDEEERRVLSLVVKFQSIARVYSEISVASHLAGNN